MMSYRINHEKTLARHVEKSPLLAGVIQPFRSVPLITQKTNLKKNGENWNMGGYAYRYIAVISPIYRAVRRAWQMRAYAGSDVHCVICGKGFSGWLKGISIPTCPYCRSQPRHRFLWSALNREWEGKSHAVNLLHFAPEWCLQRKFKRDPRIFRYLTIDIAAPNADIHADITRLPGELAGSFDTVVCSHVLEHVVDDKAAMRELLQTLKPGGKAYIQVPLREGYETDEDASVVDPKERERRFGQFDHVRLYGRDITERLKNAGFRVTERRPIEIVGKEGMRKGGLWDDVLFECCVI